MKAAVQMRFEGVRELERFFDDLPNREQARLLRDAMRPALVPINRASKNLAKNEKDTGNLYKSIGIVARAYPNQRAAVGYVGPRRGFRGPDGRLATRYAHLVEFGHRNLDGSFTSGKFILRRAFEQAREEAQRIFAQKYAEQLFRYTERLVRRHNTRRRR